MYQYDFGGIYSNNSNALAAARGPAKLLISLGILCEKVVDILDLFVYYLKHDEETNHTHNQATRPQLAFHASNGA